MRVRLMHARTSPWQRPASTATCVVGQSEDAAWPRGRPRRHSIPQSVPLFLAHGSGPLPCTRALSEYAGASHTQVRGCARARVFPITCNFVGLVKHSGTEWVTVGREKKNTTRKNNYLSPLDVQSPVTYLPTYTRCLFFFPLLALRLPQCAIGMALGQGHVSRGAHWVVAQ